MTPIPHRRTRRLLFRLITIAVVIQVELFIETIWRDRFRQWFSL